MKKKTKKEEFPGYPSYPQNQDIYNRANETELDPEDLSKLKSAPEETGPLNEKEFADDVSGSDLDIPGSEDDDAQEEIGNEDEENNYYSLGGDNHDNN